jgi:hypothetical protein
MTDAIEVVAVLRLTLPGRIQPFWLAGLGCSIMPFRFGVPPEIVLVTLGAAPAVA